MFLHTDNFLSPNGQRIQVNIQIYGTKAHRGVLITCEEKNTQLPITNYTPSWGKNTQGTKKKKRHVKRGTIIIAITLLKWTDAKLPLCRGVDTMMHSKMKTKVRASSKIIGNSISTSLSYCSPYLQPLLHFQHQ